MNIELQKREKTASLGMPFFCRQNGNSVEALDATKGALVDITE